jgi:hypothetical protein
MQPPAKTGGFLRLEETALDAPTKVIEADLIDMASAGDLSALRRLTISYITRQFHGFPVFEAYMLAEPLARLAAARGDSDDKMRLAGLLRIRARHVAELGDEERAIELLSQSEAICDAFNDLPLSEGVEFLAGVLTVQADAANEAAADRLNKLMQALSAGDADQLRRTINAALRERAAAGSDGAMFREF